MTLHPFSIHKQAHSLKKCLEVMESQMAKARDEEQAELHSDISGRGEDYDGEADFVRELYEERLIPIMRYSLAVTLYSFLEAHLVSSCEVIARERHSPFLLKDIGNSPLNDSKRFIEKLTGIMIGQFPEWADLKAFQKVRNCIAHQDGYVTSKHSDYEAIPGVTILPQSIFGANDRGDRIDLDQSYCGTHLALLMAFFGRLSEQLGWIPAGTSLGVGPVKIGSNSKPI